MSPKIANLKSSTLAASLCFSLLLINIALVRVDSVQAQASREQQQQEVTIPDGTEFTVINTEEISSKTSAEGDPVTFKVKDDVIVNGQVVIAKDAIVKGIISNAEKSGRMGKGGKLSIRLESTTTTDNQKIRLRASKGKQGDDATGTTVALTVLFGPLGLLKKGKEAKMKAGQEIKVFTDEEKKITLAAKN